MAAAAKAGQPASETALPQPARPVDLAQLTNQTMGDRALEREVLDLFVNQALMVRDRLPDADAEERRRLAHTLKGSARSIGAFAIATCLDEIEANPEDRAAIKRLPELIDRLRDFVAAIHR